MQPNHMHVIVMHMKVSLIPRLSPSDNDKSGEGRAWYPFTRDAWHIDVTVTTN